MTKVYFETSVISYLTARAAKFNYDLNAIYKDIKRQETESEREFVSYPPKFIQSVNQK